MSSNHKIASGILLAAIGVGLALIPMGAFTQSAAGSQESQNSEPVPAFHDSAPTGALPETLSPSLFPDTVAQNAYMIAARIKRVLYQQPCYCHCDRSQGHGSLLDCFTGHHAAVCGVCTREDFYAYEQTNKGKTPAQIREGIEHGEWQKVDVTKYQTPLPAK